MARLTISVAARRANSPACRLLSGRALLSGPNSWPKQPGGPTSASRMPSSCAAAPSVNLARPTGGRVCCSSLLAQRPEQLAQAAWRPRERIQHSIILCSSSSS